VPYLHNFGAVAPRMVRNKKEEGTISRSLSSRATFEATDLSVLRVSLSSLRNQFAAATTFVTSIIISGPREQERNSQNQW